MENANRLSHLIVERREERKKLSAATTDADRQKFKAEIKNLDYEIELERLITA